VLGSLAHEPTGNFGSPCNVRMGKLLLQVEDTLMIPMFEHHFVPFFYSPFNRGGNGQTE